MDLAMFKGTYGSVCVGGGGMGRASKVCVGLVGS